MPNAEIGVCASGVGQRAAMTSPAFSGRQEGGQNERPHTSLPRRFLTGRDRRAAASPAPSAASGAGKRIAQRVSFPFRSALPGGGIAARCPYLFWSSGLMPNAEIGVCASGVGQRAPMNTPAFSGRQEGGQNERPHTSLPRRFLTGRDRRAAASPGAERSVRRRKLNRKARVFFAFVPPSWASGIQLGLPCGG